MSRCDFTKVALQLMFCLFKTKYFKGRHFVATNFCFANSSQKRKQTNLLTFLAQKVGRGLVR